MSSVELLAYQREHGLCEAVAKTTPRLVNYYCQRRATMVVTFGGSLGGDVRACKQHATIWQTWPNFQGMRDLEGSEKVIPEPPALPEIVVSDNEEISRIFWQLTDEALARAGYPGPIDHGEAELAAIKSAMGTRE